MIKIAQPSVPKGGGAIRGIGETFQPHEFTGTASLTIPIRTSPCRSFEPRLSLDYSSGSGNGLFGLGWALSIPSISRKTSKGIPKYDESDTFVFSNTEDLVQVEDGQRDVTVEAIDYAVSTYRLRIEGLFARIERWVAKAGGDSYWRVISKDNVISVYGATPGARVSDPTDPGRVFQWLLCETFDLKGNRAIYQYQAEIAGDASRYLERIKYGNDPRLTAEDKWCFEVVFVYGDRKDAFASYKPGFEIRTRRLCHRIQMFHRFEPDKKITEPALVGAMHFVYEGQPTITYLKSVTQVGYQADGTERAMPPLAFDYSRFDPVKDHAFKRLALDSGQQFTGAFANGNHQMVDLYGEGLPGILYTDDDSVRYWRPQGRGRFAPSLTPTRFPIERNLENAAYTLTDLEAEGALALVVTTPTRTGYYESLGKDAWQPFRTFVSTPTELLNPQRQLVDVTGDGRPDLLLFEADGVITYVSKGKLGFDQSHRQPALVPLPVTGHPSAREAIRVADIFGDGGSHLVRIRCGSVECWPNLGYGRFGSRIELNNAPSFEGELDASRLFLADVDGSGPVDLVYAYADRVEIFRNESGNGFSDPVSIPLPGAWNDLSQISFADVLGNGTGCLVFTTLNDDLSFGHQYCDFTGGIKPHLLTAVDNNMGATTAVHYSPSTKFYLADEQAVTTRWITRLPFPVQVVERTDTVDRISGSVLVASYTYHHGYFDPIDREFRGFGRVERMDAESFEKFSAVDASSCGLVVPPVLTKTWYHTGAHASPGELFAQYAREYYQEDDQAQRLSDCEIDPAFRDEDLSEAFRALHGQVLREEVYGLDDRHTTALENPSLDAHPYIVTESNFSVRRIQSKGGRRHAICLVIPRETLSCHYERNPGDPRIQQTLTVEVDDFGNVLKEAAIAYGRRQPDPHLSLADQVNQAKTLVTYTESGVTNAIADADHYRAPLPCETRTYELTGYTPTGAAGRFRSSDFATLQFSEIDYADLPTVGKQRRLIGHVRTLYRPDDLGVSENNDPLALLPMGMVQPLALLGESYTLAFTPRLLAAEGCPGKVTDVMLQEGGYVHFNDDTNWWIPAGRSFLSPTTTDLPAVELAYAGDHFFLPHRYRDPFHTDAISTETFVTYDPHCLQVVTTRDALGNLTAAEIDYRVLAPSLVTDPNGNRIQVAFDALGMVVGTAVMGKATTLPAEGDSLVEFESDLDEDQLDQFHANPHLHARNLLQGATTRIIYDLGRFRRTRDEQPDNPAKGLPVYTATLARETHVSDRLPPEQLQVQIAVSFSDGFGREIQKKTPAEPGPVPRRDDGRQITVGADGQPEMTTDDVSPRWVGTGWTVFNNKGKPVREYEPFFTDTHGFEFDLRIGVSPVLFYDPLGRVVSTLHPDHTWEKALFAPWRQETWDVNDTVLGDPRSDPDVGGFFRCLPDSDYLPGWLGRCQEGTAQEREAARKASVHANTPAITHADSLGRTFLAVAHNKWQYGDSGPSGEEITAIRMSLDIAGRPCELIDPAGRSTARYGYDMLGNRIRQASMDAGESWVLSDVAGNPIYAWDSRAHTFRTQYDVLRRPTDSFVREGVGAEMRVGCVTYGETRPNPVANNLRGKAVELRDQAGLVLSDNYDFKGNLLGSRRQLAQSFNTTVDWARPVPLQSETYTSGTRYDALNRPTELTTPDGSVIRHGYNAATLLERLEANLRGAAVATPFVRAIAYDAQGRRTRIDYGNGTSTSYSYDSLTSRLSRLLTRRDATADEVQNLHYTYDPAGNITNVVDEAQPAICFRNARVEPSAQYRYDARYRLIEAAGREHLGQLGAAPTPSSYNDKPRAGVPFSASDGNAMGRYLESYVYDAVGNFVELRHIGSDSTNPGWTRAYAYEAPSLLEPGKRSNRLTSTTFGMMTETYGSADGYDSHGNLLRMPHLQIIQWNFKDQLQMTQRQAVNAADADGAQHQGERTWYVYDAAGQRVRTVTESAAGQVKDEHIYLGGSEIYRKTNAISLVRRTLHIMDDKQRVALVETCTTTGMPPTPQLIRYQLGNHLGSASLELDHEAQIISYEEYTPFGSTSCQAVGSQTETPKRYRYSAKERDDPTGFYYYGARYYAPWLGRWTSPDPAGTVDGLNLYEFVRSNPIGLKDQHGLNGTTVVRVQPKGGSLITAQGALLAVIRNKNFRQNPKYSKEIDELSFVERQANSARSAWSAWKERWRDKKRIGQAIGRLVPFASASLLQESLHNQHLSHSVENSERTHPVWRALATGLKKAQKSTALDDAIDTASTATSTALTATGVLAPLAVLGHVAMQATGHVMAITAETIASAATTVVRTTKAAAEGIQSSSRTARQEFNKEQRQPGQKRTLENLLASNPDIAMGIMHLVHNYSAIEDFDLRVDVSNLLPLMPPELLQGWREHRLRDSAPLQRRTGYQQSADFMAAVDLG